MGPHATKEDISAAWCRLETTAVDEVQVVPPGVAFFSPHSSTQSLVVTASSTPQACFFSFCVLPYFSPYRIRINRINPVRLS